MPDRAAHTCAAVRLRCKFVSAVWSVHADTARDALRERLAEITQNRRDDIGDSVQICDCNMFVKRVRPDDTKAEVRHGNPATRHHVGVTPAAG